MTREVDDVVVVPEGFRISDGGTRLTWEQEQPGGMVARGTITWRVPPSERSLRHAIEHAPDLDATATPGGGHRTRRLVGGWWLYHSYGPPVWWWPHLAVERRGFRVGWLTHAVAVWRPRR